MSKKNRFYNEPETTEEEIIEDVEEKEYDNESVEEPVNEVEDTEELKVEEDPEIEIPEEEDPKTPELGTVNTAKLNVREMPSLSSSILGVLNMNDTVIITDDTNSSFYQIEYDEKKGYVMKDFINV